MGLKREVFSHCKNPLWKVMEAKREYFSHRKIPPSSDGYEARVFLPSKNPPFEGWVWSASISPIEKSPQKVMEAKREYFSHQKIPKVMGAKREFFSHRWLIGSLFAPILLVGEAQNLRFTSTGGSIFLSHRKNPPKSDGRKTRDFLPMCGWTKKLLTHNFCFRWNFEHRIGETAWPETKKSTLMCEKVTCTAPPKVRIHCLVAPIQHCMPIIFQGIHNQHLSPQTVHQLKYTGSVSFQYSILHRSCACSSSRSELCSRIESLPVERRLELKL